MNAHKTLAALLVAVSVVLSGCVPGSGVVGGGPAMTRSTSSVVTERPTVKRGPGCVNDNQGYLECSQANEEYARRTVQAGYAAGAGLALLNSALGSVGGSGLLQAGVNLAVNGAMGNPLSLENSRAQAEACAQKYLCH